MAEFGMQFTGLFEIHITVSPGVPEDVVRLQNVAAANGWKVVAIALDRGVTPFQPMVTLYGSGDLPAQMRTAQLVTDMLAAHSFRATRTKLEAAISNFGVPQTAAEAAPLSDCYFEHHVKLAIDDADTPALALLVADHGARLSRNALRTSSRGGQERFVTQRCKHVGLSEASKQLARLVGVIKQQNIAILDIEKEFVVFDSNLALDAGWIPN